MSDIHVSIVETQRDLLAVQQLCRDFVTWQLAEFPEFRDVILAYFEPKKLERTLAELAEIHARPKGAMFLARTADQPVGCIMYQEADSGVAEVKRLFVASEARGKGVAMKLIDLMVERAKSDGYQEMRLDTAKFLGNAIRLYRKHGFKDIGQTIELPPEVLETAVFMHRTL